MIQRRGDLAGIDDLVAELALARRALRRQVAAGTLCGGGGSPIRTCQPVRRTWTPPDRYVCAGHDHGGVCEHDVKRCVYRVDDDGREHYSTRPLGGL